MVSPKRDSGLNPRGDSPKVFEHQQRRKDDSKESDKYGRDSCRQSDRYSSRSSHGYSRHDEYRRREKRVDEASSLSSRGAIYSDHTKQESEHGRSREYLRNDEKYSRDKYDNSQSISKDRETNSLALDRQNFRDKNASPDTAKEKDHDRRDKNSRDEKRDYHRSFGDHRSDRASYYKIDQKEPNSQKDGKKHDDQETLGKKPKLFRSGWDTQEGKNANEMERVSEGDGKATYSEVANDLNAAKVAALKAAELVNKNLVGVGVMSTEQKKKLLWGNKKSTTSQEPSGNRWDTPLFDDRERQEKFNKLMGVKNVDHKPETVGGDVEKQKEVQMDLEKQYTAGLRRRDGRTVGLGL